ncbi:glycosyl transferase family protein [Croceibacterium mercuriale]|uniref:glycosyl transferase family protein n=1 Tax=Croceibacterium mercuriale TaxID=1572751 RepID=UPI00068BE082|nr:glycosyl transferase family protein [Croceibacterium mercuriale]
MISGGVTVLQLAALVEHELLLFAGVFFLVGALDELAVDVVFGFLRLTGRVREWTINREEGERPLSGRAAVFIPAWLEHEVITDTIATTLKAWPQDALRLYVGCYCNDPRTVEAIIRGTGGDPRVRLVVHERAGPTTKADCLNRLYTAMEHDEQRGGYAFRMVVLHDAEDMVDPAGLALLDRGIAEAEFVQLPVLPEPQARSRWVGSHYCEEFAEAHGKAMVVRDALAASLPSAGVGCAFSRTMLARIAGEMATTTDATGPFSVESLTEDYELGLRIKAAGGRSRFLRVRGEDGRLIATRACFPAKLDQSVRQKARWVHGIALQGWDRMGWASGSGLGETWMRIRDRRGPLSALVLFAAYALLALGTGLWVASLAGYDHPFAMGTATRWLLALNFASFVWRAGSRYLFTTREYGPAEGFRAVLRIPLSNVIAIMAGRRALSAYVSTLRGGAPQWDKTFHHAHPSTMADRVTPYRRTRALS